MYPSLPFKSMWAGPLHGLLTALPPTSLQNLDPSSRSSNLSLFQNTNLTWNFNPKPIIAYPCPNGGSHPPSSSGVRNKALTHSTFLFLWCYSTEISPVYLPLHNSVLCTWANLHWYVPTVFLGRIILPFQPRMLKMLSCLIIMVRKWSWRSLPAFYLEMLCSGLRKTQGQQSLSVLLFAILTCVRWLAAPPLPLSWQ